MFLTVNAVKAAKSASQGGGPADETSEQRALRLARLKRRDEALRRTAGTPWRQLRREADLNNARSSSWFMLQRSAKVKSLWNPDVPFEISLYLSDSVTPLSRFPDKPPADYNNTVALPDDASESSPFLLWRQTGAL